MSENTQVKLRPLSVVQIFTQAVLLYRRNFFKFTAIFALVLLPVLFFSFAGAFVIANKLFDRLDFGYHLSFLLADLLMNLIYREFGPALVNITELGLHLLAVTTLVLAVVDTYLGQARGIFETYRRAFKLWGRMLLSMVLVLLLLLGIMVVISRLMTNSSFSFFLAGLLGGTPIFLVFLLPFLIPVVVLEKQSLLGLLRRVWDLVRPRFLQTISIVFLVLLVPFAAKFMISLNCEFSMDDIISLLVTIFGMGFPETRILVLALIVLLVRLVYIPLLVTVLVLFYIDLRVRAEGLDLALNADQNLEEAAGPLAVLAQAPKPCSDRLLIGREWWYLGAFTLISFVFCFLYLLLLFYVFRSL